MKKKKEIKKVLNFERIKENACGNNTLEENGKFYKFLFV